MRPAWMTVHEGGLRSDATPSSSTPKEESALAALCAARDDALRTIEVALESIARMEHPTLSPMRGALTEKLQATRHVLARPAALLLVDQELLRASWVELQQALMQIQQMQTEVDRFIATATSQD